MRSLKMAKNFLRGRIKSQLKDSLTTMRRNNMWKGNSWQVLGSVAIVVAMGTMAGCSSTPKLTNTPVRVVAEPAAPDLDKLRAKAVARLQHDGVRVIVVGETCRLVLPSDYTFYPNSANLLASIQPALKNVAALLRTYTTESVQVAAYTDKQDTAEYARALTTRQAQAIAKRLWQYGADTRLMTAVGQGQADPVDWNGSVQGQHNNRRVEISFRFYPLVKGYE